MRDVRSSYGLFLGELQKLQFSKVSLPMGQKNDRMAYAGVLAGIQKQDFREPKRICRDVYDVKRVACWDAHFFTKILGKS